MPIPLFTAVLLLFGGSRSEETSVQSIVDRAAKFSHQKLVCDPQVGRIKVVARYPISKAVEAVDQVTALLGLTKIDAKGVVRLTDPFAKQRYADLQAQNEALRRKLVPEILKSWANTSLNTGLSFESNRAALDASRYRALLSARGSRQVPDEYWGFEALKYTDEPLKVGVAKTLVPKDIGRFLDGHWLIMSTGTVPGMLRLPGSAETYEHPSTNTPTDKPLYVTLRYDVSNGQLFLIPWNLNRKATNGASQIFELMSGQFFRSLIDKTNPYAKWAHERSMAWKPKLSMPGDPPSELDQILGPIQARVTPQSLADIVAANSRASILALPATIKSEPKSYRESGQIRVANGWCLIRSPWELWAKSLEGLSTRRPSSPPKPLNDPVDMLDAYVVGLTEFKDYPSEVIRRDPFYETVEFPTRSSLWFLWRGLSSEQKRSVFGKGLEVGKLGEIQKEWLRSAIVETLTKRMEWTDDPRKLFDSTSFDSTVFTAKCTMRLGQVQFENGVIRHSSSGPDFRRELDELTSTGDPNEHLDLTVNYSYQFTFTNGITVKTNEPDYEIRPWIYRGIRSGAKSAVQPFIDALKP